MSEKWLLFTLTRQLLAVLEVLKRWKSQLTPSPRKRNSSVCRSLRLYPDAEAGCVEAFWTHLGPCPVSKPLSIGDSQNGLVLPAVEGCTGTLQKDLLLTRPSREQSQQGHSGQQASHFGCREAASRPQSSYSLLSAPAAIRWLIHRVVLVWEGAAAAAGLIWITEKKAKAKKLKKL